MPLHICPEVAAGLAAGPCGGRFPRFRLAFRLVVRSLLRPKLKGEGADRLRPVGSLVFLRLLRTSPTPALHQTETHVTARMREPLPWEYGSQARSGAHGAGTRNLQPNLLTGRPAATKKWAPPRPLGLHRRHTCSDVAQAFSTRRDRSSGPDDQSSAGLFRLLLSGLLSPESSSTCQTTPHLD